MIKQVIVLRKDLEMSKGKMVAQGAHASLESALKVKKRKPKIFKTWKKEGQRKVVLKANLKEIKDIEERTGGSKIKTALVKDRGLTEIEPGTLTALGVGPDKGKKVDKLTSSLPLL